MQAQLVTRLGDWAKKWLDRYSTVEEQWDAVVLEQFLNTLDPETRIWVKERKPKTSDEAGRLADDYEQARGQTGSGKGPKKLESQSSGQVTGARTLRCFSCGDSGHVARNCRKLPKSGGASGAGGATGPSAPSPPATGGKELQPAVTNTRREVKCYNCGQKGHISKQCPSNAALLCQADGTSRQRQQRAGTGVMRAGSVEGRSVADILLDTGCSQTLVRSDLVPAEKLIQGDAVTIRCAHGDTVLYPLAEVLINVDGFPLQVEAAVSETLPVSVLLGTDIPALGDLLGKDINSTSRTAEAEVLVVTTRAQAWHQAVEERDQALRERECGVQPTLAVPDEPASGPDGGAIVDTASTSGERDPDCDGGDGLEFIGSEFSDDLFAPGREKRQLTRRENRELRQRHAKERLGDAVEGDAAMPHHPLDLPAEELQRLQAEDETLSKVARAADGEHNSAGTGFFRRGGLLYRRCQPPGRDPEMAVEQLVLPRSCRSTVLELAHTIPLAGHLGRDKTAKRVLQRFYWPTLFKDVATYCRQCPQCQKASDRMMRRAPLIPLPVVGEPFQRIAMDLVGPLPRSRAGHRYILVVCDYATRYPEAIPMKSIDAERVAEELVQLFSRVGILQEILTDQGSNFTSRLLGEVYNLLHVQALRTTPYHPQTDGLVERFNKTLKALLRKCATDSGKDWDKLLPFLLFAYREVPQASTGFSPFELLYGREVRGPLDVLKETWEADKRSSESVVSHVRTHASAVDIMTPWGSRPNNTAHRCKSLTLRQLFKGYTECLLLA